MRKEINEKEIKTRDIPDSNSGISRKEFIAGAAMATVCAVAASTSTGCVGINKERSSSEIRFVMVIDLRKCSGCHSCSIACKSEFDVPLGVWRCWVKQVDTGQYPNVKRNFLPRLCNNCVDAPCVNVCPTTASHFREADGTVQIDEKKCIACKLCIAACPYNSRFKHPNKGVTNKCTLCVHRVDKGVVPACVNGCPMKAITFGDLNDPNSEVAKLVATEAVSVLKPDLGTDPSVYYIELDSSVVGPTKKEV